MFYGEKTANSVLKKHKIKCCICGIVRGFVFGHSDIAKDGDSAKPPPPLPSLLIQGERQGGNVSRVMGLFRPFVRPRFLRSKRGGGGGSRILGEPGGGVEDRCALRSF